MKKVITIIVISLFVFSKAQSQAVGFEGKRFHVQYDYQYVIPYISWNMIDVSNVFLSMSHNLQLDYAVGRTFSIGASGGYGDFITSINSTSTSTYYAIQARDVGVYFRRYNLGYGSIAPLGTYWELGVHRLFAKDYQYEIIANTRNILEETKGQFNLLTLGWGRQAILFDKVTYHLGGRGGYILEAQTDDLAEDLLIYFLFRFKIGVGIPF